jgi:hypothetical protein
LGKNVSKVGVAFSAAFTAPFLLIAKNAVEAFDVQAKAVAQVEAGLKSTGEAAGFTSKELQKMASELQSKTLFGDEQILKDATAQLLTFTNIAGEQFARTQKAALDLATRLDGDLKGASIQLGKALNNPVKGLAALGRSGIQFSEDQKKVINELATTNRLAEAQTLILDELEKQYGGSAEAAARAGLGPLQQMQMAFGDLLEVIGAVIAEALIPLADRAKKLFERLQTVNPAIIKTAVVIGGVLAAVGPLLFILGQAITTMGAVAGAAKGLAASLALISAPVLIAVAAIGAVVAAVVFAYTKFEGFRRVVNGLGNTIKELFNILKEGGAAFIRAFGELKEGEFRKAAKSIEEGIRKTNPVTIAFTEGKRLKEAFTDGFADDTNYLKKVQKDFQKAVSAAGISDAVAPLAPLATAGGGGGTGTARNKKTSISAPLQTLKTDISTLEQFGKSGAANANLQTYSETLAKLKGEQAGFFADMQRNAQAAALAVQESLAQVNVALLANGETYINWGNILQNAALIGISSFAQTVEQGISSLKQFGKAVKAAAVEIIGALIKQGVTSIVSNTLIKLGGALGPLAIPLAAAAGSLAKGIFTSAIASISTPRLARGGITTGETLAVVGDNPSGKEAIIPFERMGEFLNMAGAQAVRLTGLFEVKGSDLVLVLDRAQQEKLRIR